MKHQVFIFCAIAISFIGWKKAESDEMVVTGKLQYWQKSIDVVYESAHAIDSTDLPYGKRIRLRDGLYELGGELIKQLKPQLKKD